MGTGVGGLGDILLMPTVGAVGLNEEEYSSAFSHAQESANPGYYRVFLQDPKVTAELTATARCGFHKYTFPASDNAHIILDLAHGIGNSVLESSLTVENNTTISGTRISNGWGGRRAAYFVIQFSKPFDAFGIRQDGMRLNADAKSAQGKSLQAFVNYKTTDNEAIYVRVGISGTGVEGARKNLASEIPTWDFDRTRADARAQWSAVLDKVKIETPDPKLRRTFYTNFYQSCLAPVLFNDVDRAYRGGDKKNHDNPGFQNYTTFSLWDTFRAQHPLLTLVQPDRVPDMVNSMLALERERGQQEMPVWPLWGNETGTMIGYHSAPVIADAYLKGFKGFDVEAAYQALRATALNKRNGQEEFGRLGYVVSASGGQKQSVSRTLEFAYDDWCIAKMAQSLGHNDDAQMFFKRSANYRNLFDQTVGFMRGRKADGSWRRPFNPKAHVWDDYTEANAWQYLWTAMQDSPGLVKLLGGDAAFIQKMETMFNEKDDVVTNIPDITGLIGQYAHGNEPVHHVAYLYNYAGAPYKTQERVRQIMRLFYNDTPVGAPGNNDCGQMSAWYVFSALGFYPVNPAEGLYVIGSPVVDKATLNFGKRAFTVVAENNSPQNIYIQSATLNGRVLVNTYISHAQLLAGGELRFRMGSKPNTNWGRVAANRPPSGLATVYTQTPLPVPSSTRRVVLPLPIRIAAGSNDPVAGFISDPNMEEGQLNSANAQIDVSTPNAAPAPVYQSERYGSDFTFRYPVPAGKYSVRLHFAEIFDNAAGQRVENVDINGQRVLTNFDTFAAAGGMNKAVVREFRDIAPDAQGNITIRVSAAPGSPDQNAKISAIEIAAQ
jgi:predicted alpha-1,2-mannosidase